MEMHGKIWNSNLAKREENTLEFMYILQKLILKANFNLSTLENCRIFLWIFYGKVNTSFYIPQYFFPFTPCRWFESRLDIRAHTLNHKFWKFYMLLSLSTKFPVQFKSIIIYLNIKFKLKKFFWFTITI